MKPAVEQAWDQVAQAQVKHTDGTSWLQAGLTLSLWTIATTMATVFNIVSNGSKKTLESLYGKLHGILVSDRARALNFWCSLATVRWLSQWGQSRNGMLRDAGSRSLLMCVAALATGSTCECVQGRDLNANVPSETVEVGLAGETLVLSYQGDTNLRFGSILVQLRLVGDATVLATVPGTAANEAYLPANSAELTQTMPEAVISPCIEHDSPSSAYDADCPEAFDLTFSVVGAEAAIVPEVEVEVLTTAIGDRCTPEKAAYATFERMDSD